MNVKRKYYVLLIILSLMVLGIIVFMTNEDDSGREQAVRITEVCSHNSICAYDDNGMYGEDYIEITAGDKDINLLGFSVSDDPKEKRKYVLGDITLHSGESVIFWRNEEISGDPYDDDYIPRDFHGFSFGISDGETIYLSDPEEELVQKVKIPALPEGWVYASSSDEPDSFICTKASPYEWQRKSDMKTYEGVAEGSGFDIDEFSVYEADHGKEADGISVMEISIAPEDLYDYDNGIYVKGRVYDTYADKYGIADDLHANYACEGRGWERRARIDYYAPDGEKTLSQVVGIRIHGGHTVAEEQKSFNIYARPEYDGNEYFSYDFFGEKLDKIMLRTGGIDLYASKLRDVLNQSLISDRDAGVQKFEPCCVYINGEYWGLYNLQEVISPSYIEANFGISSGDVLIMKNDEINSDTDYRYLYNDVFEYAVSHDLSLEENYSYIEERIDIQSYIDQYAFQIYIGNGDIITNNFARWRSLEDGGAGYRDGRWRWLIYDTDQSAGIMALAAYDMDHFTGGHSGGHNPLAFYPDPFFGSLLQNEGFKENFVTSFSDMANYNFDYERVSEKLDDLADIYRVPAAASIEKYGSYDMYAYTYYPSDVVATFDSDIDVIRTFYKERYDYIMGYMKQDMGLTGDMVKVTVPEAEHGTVSLNTIPKLSGDFEGKYYTDYPITLKCTPDEGYEFEGWVINGEMISSDWEITIELKDDITVETKYG